MCKDAGSNLNINFVKYLRPSKVYSHGMSYDRIIGHELLMMLMAHAC